MRQYGFFAMATDVSTLSTRIAERLRARNAVSEAFFPREAPRLAEASQEMSERFLAGGRLLAFGRGPYATDAQHVSVEFIHPVIVGKRALPALDLSLAYRDWTQAVLQPEDIVMGFGPPGGDPEVEEALAAAGQAGAQTFALPGEVGGEAGGNVSEEGGSYAVEAPSEDPFIHQEMIEVLYHTLWETVHVFFEHHEMGHDVGESGFLYPYLGDEKQDTTGILAEVASSIVAKAEEDERLREQAASDLSASLADTTRAMRERLDAGGTFIFFGNGGSATDANDWALDCVTPPEGRRPLPAISLAHEAPNHSAIANDVGVELIFLRQLVAHAQPQDIAVALSTSGSSGNVIAALKEARKRDMLTVALTGYDGGEIARQGLADFPLVVRSDYIPRIQEIHASIYHTILDMLREE